MMNILNTKLLLIAFSWYGLLFFSLFVTVFIAGYYFVKSFYENSTLQSREYVFDDVYNVTPHLPSPTSQELNIEKNSKLEKIFNMFIQGLIITNELCYEAVQSPKVATYVFKLRKRGMVIDTLIMPNNVVGYVFKKFDYDKITKNIN